MDGTVSTRRRGYGRGQTRVVAGKEVFVEIPPMNRTFTLKCDDDFLKNLDKLLREAPGRTSYAAIIRELVAKEAGSLVEMESRPIRKVPHQPIKMEKIHVVAGSDTKGYSPEQMRHWRERLTTATEESGPKNFLEALLTNRVEGDPEEFVARMEAKHVDPGQDTERVEGAGEPD